jgi:hypothetical protein
MLSLLSTGKDFLPAAAVRYRTRPHTPTGVDTEVDADFRQVIGKMGE